MEGKKEKKYWWKAIASFLVVLFCMPLGHALMIVTEHALQGAALHYAAFAMGAVGLAMAIVGVFVKGDTKQTLWGFFGALLFWTGWVEFLFMYYAERFGTQPQLDPLTGEVVTRPGYLIMPTSFGFWMAIMVVYIFCVRTGCNFISWWQRHLFRGRRDEIVTRPLSRHTSLVTFMEFNMIIWASYLLLMFCYDPVFLGDRHPVTLLVGVACFICSFFIFAKQLRLSAWGANIRMSIATVMVFWTPIEILGRNNWLSQIWMTPREHWLEMLILLLALILLVVYLLVKGAQRS